jgi:hypothetical protein
MSFLTIILFFFVQTNAAELKGQATSMDGATQLYTEVHSITVDEAGLNKKIETKYLKPNGEIFAEMTSDFSKSNVIPQINFRDRRFDKTEELIFKENSDVVVFKTRSGTQSAKTKEFKIKKDMVAGQGFDNFVKINFEALQKGTVPMSFGVLSEMDFFSFNGSKKGNPEKKTVQFGIDLTSFFLRLFSSELILDYDLQTKQILSYRGLSNLLTDDGQKQNVLIKYEMTDQDKKP